MKYIPFILLYVIFSSNFTSIYAEAEPTATPTSSLTPKEAHDQRIVLTASLPQFTSIKHVQDTAKSLGIRIDYLVKYRNDTGACDLLLGAGSPDLSGIGAMVGYYIQFIFSMLAILTHASVGWFRVRSSGQDALLLLKNSPLPMLILVNFETTVWFSAAIAVASFAYWFRSPDYYELKFLGYLGLYQTNVVNCSLGIFFHVRPQLQPSKNEVSISVMPVYSIVQLLRLALIYYLNTKDLLPCNTETMNFERHCGATGNDGDWNRVTDKFRTAFTFTTTIVPFVLLLCWPNHRFMILETMAKYHAGIRQMRRDFTESVLKMQKLYPLLSQFLFVLPWVVPAVGAGSTLGILRLARLNSKNHTGGEFEDDKWGFGQVLSVAAWMPLVYLTVGSVSKFFWLRKFGGADCNPPSATASDGSLSHGPVLEAHTTGGIASGSDISLSSADLQKKNDVFITVREYSVSN